GRRVLLERPGAAASGVRLQRGSGGGDPSGRRKERGVCAVPWGHFNTECERRGRVEGRRPKRGNAGHSGEIRDKAGKCLTQRTQRAEHREHGEVWEWGEMA